MRDAGHELLPVSTPGPYGERLRELGYRRLPAPMERRSLNPLRELALVWCGGAGFRSEAGPLSGAPAGTPALG